MARGASGRFGWRLSSLGALVALLVLLVGLFGCSGGGDGEGDDGAGPSGAAGVGAGSSAAGSSGTAGTAAGVAGSRGAGASAGRGGANGQGEAGGQAGAVAPGDAGSSDAPRITADDVWAQLSVMAIADPLDHGGVGDGVADDLPALEAAVEALPEAGGIVFLQSGRTFRKADLLVIEKSHVKLWALNTGAELLQLVNGTRRTQSILCRDQTGCGFFGLHLRSDAEERFDALEDNPIAADGSTLVEVVGCEVEGGAAAGIFLYGSTEHYVHGNFIHHTWADHVHHTAGASASWVYRNFILNEQPSRGDDGIACVTYGPSSARCRDMEWWSNVILHTDWGRGYSVIGGEDIHIHDNWAIGVAGAGIIVASEASYDSASSTRIRIERNVVYQAGHSIGHPGILVSGLNAAAEPLTELTLRDNVAVDNEHGAYREEGDFDAVTNAGLSTDAVDLPQPVPTLDDVELEDTAVLRTRDVSHVAPEQQAGLHRIHVRSSPSASDAEQRFEQRFEYVVSGDPTAVAAFCEQRSAEGDYVAEQRSAEGRAHALVLTRAPVVIPGTLAGVSFRELRAGAEAALAWLWKRIDEAAY